MAIAKAVENYLTEHGVNFDVVRHPRSFGSMETAQAAHIHGDTLAKAVLLHDKQGYVLAVLPSTHRVEVSTLQGVLQRHLALATEDETQRIFGDCERGSLPAVGDAYGVFTVVDDSITHPEEVFFEGGDHATLVRVRGEDFRRLLDRARRVQFSHHI
jgi:Ala-tRNA(Pro) deacylase